MGKKWCNGQIKIFTFPDCAVNLPASALYAQEYLARPLMVMALPDDDKPITADYDLFAVCPTWDAYGADDQKMDPTLDDLQQNASHLRTMQKSKNGAMPAAQARALVSLDKIAAARTAEHLDQGNVTPRIGALIVALGLAMGGPYPRVHHNAESGRPFAPNLESCFPLTVIHPRLGIAGFPWDDAIISNVSVLEHYFKRIYTAGYYPPRNRAWNMASPNALLARGDRCSALSSVLLAYPK